MNSRKVPFWSCISSAIVPNTPPTDEWQLALCIASVGLFTFHTVAAWLLDLKVWACEFAKDGVRMHLSTRLL